MRILLCCAVMLLQVGAAAAAPPYRAGFTEIEVRGETPFPLAVWYPTQAAETTWPGGLFDVRAARDAPAPPGRFPLILLSHGSGGDQFHHHDWGSQLAREGFVVAAPTHPGDSLGDVSGRGSDVQLTGRPWQIREALDTLKADPAVAPSIDTARIGMVGYSAGGYTTVVSVGGRPDYALWGRHCRANPQDDELCPVDGSWTPPRITRPDWPLPPPIAAIRAAVVMAPAGILFDAAGLANVTVPLRLYRAADDRLVRNPWNADNIAAHLPKPPEIVTVPGDHFVFLAPCPQRMAARFPGACQDPPGVDRAAIHAQIAAELVAFFRRTLGPGPAPPEKH